MSKKKAQTKPDQVLIEKESEEAPGPSGRFVPYNPFEDSELPSSLVVAPGQSWPIVEEYLDGALGCTDFGEGVIYIEKDQPKVGKHLILLHEAIHVACEKLIEAGIIKRQPKEQFVTYLAGTLFGILAGSGLWSRIHPDEAFSFYAQFTGSPCESMGDEPFVFGSDRTGMIWACVPSDWSDEQVLALVKEACPHDAPYRLMRRGEEIFYAPEHLAVSPCRRREGFVHRTLVR